MKVASYPFANDDVVNNYNSVGTYTATLHVSAADMLVGQLNTQMIKNMENENAILKIQSPSATYTLPSYELNDEAARGAVVAFGKSLRCTRASR